MSVTHRTYCTGGTLSDLILWYVTQNLTDCQVKRDYDLICNRSCHWEACMVWTQIPISAGTNIHTHLFIKHNVPLQKQSLNQTCPISPQGEKEKKSPVLAVMRLPFMATSHKHNLEVQGEEEAAEQTTTHATALFPSRRSATVLLWWPWRLPLGLFNRSVKLLTPSLIKNYKNKTLH